jgi:hypothetical protein
MSRVHYVLGLFLFPGLAAIAGPVLGGESSQAGTPSPGGVWTCRWTHGVDKVFRKDRPFQGQQGKTLQVELAANEYEGVQLVLRAARPLGGVRVSVSDLLGEGGRRIASKQVEVLVVGYVNTKKPPYAVDYVGW